MYYPQVTGESETLDLVLAGASLARYGDGELKMAERQVGIKSQDYHPALRRRLREILQESGRCLVGIPNIRSDTPKGAFWGKFMGLAHLLSDGRPYCSAFVTRPDSAPWIDHPKYWARLESLWKGLPVTLVRGSGKSFTAERLRAAGAGEVTEVMAPRHNGWDEYERLLDQVGRPARALLCLGPSATVMAVDLCARGVHAVDMGHAGMFYAKHLRGEAMWVTDAEKGVDRRKGAA